MNRLKLLCGLTIVSAALMSFPSFAGWEYTNEGNWRYEENGTYVCSDWKKVNDLWYYFDESGIMETGWLNWNNGWYYLEKEGHMVTGEHLVDNKVYCFDASGKLYNEKQVHCDGLNDERLLKACYQYQNEKPYLEKLLNSVNEERSERGKSSLVLEPTLCITGMYRCIEMIEEGYFSHTYNNGTRFVTVENCVDPDWCGAIAENLYRSGVRYEDAEKDYFVANSTELFHKSPVHYQYVIDDRFSKVGFGFYVNDDNGQVYIAQIYN